MLASSGLRQPALATLTREAYRVLGLQSYFTAGEKEVCAWTIPIDAHGSAGRRRDPLRLREGVHSRRGLYPERPGNLPERKRDSPGGSAPRRRQELRHAGR